MTRQQLLAALSPFLLALVACANETSTAADPCADALEHVARCEAELGVDLGVSGAGDCDPADAARVIATSCDGLVGAKADWGHNASCAERGLREQTCGEIRQFHSEPIEGNAVRLSCVSGYLHFQTITNNGEAARREREMLEARYRVETTDVQICVPGFFWGSYDETCTWGRCVPN